MLILSNKDDLLCHAQENEKVASGANVTSGLTSIGNIIGSIVGRICLLSLMCLAKYNPKFDLATCTTRLQKDYYKYILNSSGIMSILAFWTESQVLMRQKVSTVRWPTPGLVTCFGVDGRIELFVFRQVREGEWASYKRRKRKAKLSRLG